MTVCMYRYVFFLYLVQLQHTKYSHACSSLKTKKTCETFNKFEFGGKASRITWFFQIDCILHLTGLSFFGNALELYHSEHKEALAIQQKRHLGLLLVDKTLLKEKLVSSPLRCLEVRTSYMQTHTVLLPLHSCSRVSSRIMVFDWSF